MASELDVAYVAQLARLHLTAEETKLFQKQLGDVLKYAEKLKEVNVEGVEAAAHAVPIFNVFRADDPCDWFTAAEALSNAPRQANDLFVVTKAVERRSASGRRSASSNSAIVSGEGKLHQMGHCSHCRS